MSRASIGDICALFDMTPRAVRHYEERGLIDVQRDRRNVRVYGQEARERLQWIKLLREADIPLDDIGRLFDLDPVTRATRAAAALDAVARRIARLDRAMRRAVEVRRRLMTCADEGATLLDKSPAARESLTA